jgi:hypothetical protein
MLDFGDNCVEYLRILLAGLCLKIWFLEGGFLLIQDRLLILVLMATAAGKSKIVNNPYNFERARAEYTFIRIDLFPPGT